MVIEARDGSEPSDVPECNNRRHIAARLNSGTRHADLRCACGRGAAENAAMSGEFARICAAIHRSGRIFATGSPSLARIWP